MLNLMVLLGMFAIPVAGLVLTPASRNLGRGDISLTMACLLLWLVLFWSTTLALVWSVLANL